MYVVKYRRWHHVISCAPEVSVCECVCLCVRECVYTHTHTALYPVFALDTLSHKV